MCRRLAFPAALSVLTLGLASCAGDDGTGPVTEAPPTLISGNTSDGGAGSDDGGSNGSDGGGSPDSAPDIPAPDPADYSGMDEETAEGAEQFTRYFTAAMFWGYQSGDSSLISENSRESCGACSEAISEIDSVKSNGTYWSPVEVEEAAIDGSQGDDFAYSVGYGVIVSEHTENDAESGEKTEVPRSRYSLGFGVDWEDNRWVVSELYVEAFVEEG